jgi:DNA-binding response OmpR family regulator
MIIDDEPAICKTLQAILRRKGFDITYHTDPAQALEAYARQSCNVVLVDVLMPRMSGREVIARIKDMNPLCNVIVMTAFSKMTHVVACIEAGAVDYITKPFTDLSLLARVVEDAVVRVQRWSRSFGVQETKLRSTAMTTKMVSGTQAAGDGAAQSDRSGKEDRG